MIRGLAIETAGLHGRAREERLKGTGQFLGVPVWWISTSRTVHASHQVPSSGRLACTARAKGASSGRIGLGDLGGDHAAMGNRGGGSAKPAGGLSLCPGRRPGP